MESKFIDVHHHARPDEYVKALAEAGVTKVGGKPIPSWDAQSTLAMMDSSRIATAILSAPDSEFAFRDRTLACRLSRYINTQYAELRDKHPRRFGGFASLPVPHWDAALVEMQYALDVLKLDGVMLNTSYGGMYPGNEDFDELFTELNSRKAVVFVHPASPAGTDALDLDIPPYLLEFVFDTTRCIMNMVTRKIPERFPNIRFIFSHGGGTAPFLSFRLHRLISFRRGSQTDAQIQGDLNTVAAALKSFYYDTALTTNAPVLHCLTETVGIDRVLFGSDFPQVRENLIHRMTNDLDAFASDERVRKAISRGTALELFPRLADPIAKQREKV